MGAGEEGEMSDGGEWDHGGGYDGWNDEMEGLRGVAGLSLGYESEDDADVPDWRVYSRDLDAREAFVIQLNNGTWAMPGWKAGKRRCSVSSFQVTPRTAARGPDGFLALLKTESWCHLQILRENINCNCPVYTKSESNPHCVHVEFYLRRPESFETDVPCTQAQNSGAVVLLLHHGPFLVVFSIANDIAAFQTGKRHIVTLRHDGVWSCTCTQVTYGHKRTATSAALAAKLLSDDGRFIHDGIDVMTSFVRREQAGFAAASPKEPVSHR